jgi:tetratricopeptide (TPR) repeat protein
VTDPEPDRETGAWLRREREKRGWAMDEMARRLVRAAHDNGDTGVPDAGIMKLSAYRWERTGRLSERYKFHYCRAFGITRDQFGKTTTTDIALTDQAVSPASAASPALPGVVDPLLSASPAMTYREREEPGWGEFAAGHEVVMAAAHESSDNAAEHEQHAAIGEFTFGQLRAEVVRLSRQMDAGSPFPVFLNLRRVRDRIYTLLDRRLWPGEQSDLYFLLGCINGLMGATAKHLGYLDAAEELLRAGSAYANIIDHNPLRAMLRLKLSGVMYHRERFSESRDLAADGLRYVSRGSQAAELHVRHGRAAARLGDLDAARRSVALADDALDSNYRDDVVDIGGEFFLTQATHQLDAGKGLVEISGAERDAAAKLEQAISLYDAGLGEEEGFWFAGKPLAGATLAVVRLRSGALDAAVAALESALALPPEQRISDITSRLADVRRELAAPIFHGSPQARALGEQIEAFNHEAVTAGLHSLTG